MDDSEAARDAKLCGEIDMIGVLYFGEEGLPLASKKLRTSVWD